MSIFRRCVRSFNKPYQRELINSCQNRSSKLETDAPFVVPDRNFDTFWSAINSTIQLVDLKLQRLRYPYDNTTYIGIVNTLADDPSKLATHFTPEQIAYFRTLVRH